MRRDILFQILSALFFALATVFAKYVNASSSIPAVEITLFRFVLGFIGTAFYVLRSGRSVRPVRFSYIWLRAVMNLASVVLFFLGVQYSTVTKANLLNMTFPIFVFLYAPWINHERAKPVNFLFLLLSMIGIYLVVLPSFSAFDVGDLYSFASGVVGGLAVALLRESRRYDSSLTVIFFLMGIGAVGNLALALPSLVMPSLPLAGLLVLSALAGFLGQVFTTAGFRTLDAPRGSLLTTSRILFAGILGATLFHEPVTARMIAGALLIVLSLLGVSGVVQPARRASAPSKNRSA